MGIDSCQGVNIYTYKLCEICQCRQSNEGVLGSKTGDIFLIFFSKKIGVDISCILSPKHEESDPIF